MAPLLQKILRMHWFLLLLMLLILPMGVHVMSSAARHLSSGGEWFANRHQLWIYLGLALYFLTAFINYRLLRYLAVPLYGIGIVLMIAAILYGNEVHQLRIAGIAFQPGQGMVVAGIILAAFFVEQLPRKYQLFRLPYVMCLFILVLCGIPCCLVAIAGDMGSAMMWVPLTASILLLAKIPFRYLVTISLICLAVAPPIYYLVLPKVSERGSQRVELFVEEKLGVKSDILGDGYAKHNVSLAIGKAGYKGAGHMAQEEQGSLHAARAIPWKTAHNDFIFAVFGEEEGFRGGILLLILYGLLLLFCMHVAIASHDLTGQVLAGSIATLVGSHVFQNIGMCIGLLPITGIPLPLMSYSGTFMLTTMFLLGVVQSVWIHRKRVKLVE